MKNNKNYLYLCIILSILLFLTGIYFNFKYHSSISSNPYAEESSIEYMVCLKETIETPTHAYKKGEWYFFIQDENGIFLYLNDATCGLLLDYDEAERFLI